MTCRSLGLIAALTLASVLSAAEPTTSTPDLTGVELDVIAVEQRWVTAEVRLDLPALQDVLDDRFIATFGAGKPITKGPYIQGYAGRAVDPAASQTLSARTIRIADDTAVTTGTDLAARTDNGKVVTTSYRYTATYIKRDGHWRALALHMVRLPPAP